MGSNPGRGLFYSVPGFRLGESLAYPSYKRTTVIYIKTNFLAPLFFIPTLLYRLFVRLALLGGLTCRSLSSALPGVAGGFWEVRDCSLTSPTSRGVEKHVREGSFSHRIIAA